MSARLQAAVEAQVAPGAPGALARVEAARGGLTWGGSAGHLAQGNSRFLRPDDAFRAASVTKSVPAAVAVRLAREGLLGLDEPLAAQLAPDLLQGWRALDAPSHHPASTARAHLGRAQPFRRGATALPLRPDDQTRPAGPIRAQVP